MAYEFGNRLAESTAANQNRNAGVYTRTLIGQTIRETPVGMDRRSGTASVCDV